MLRRWWLTIVLFIPCLIPAAGPKWILMRSEHFEAYSSAGERFTRDAIRHFEQVRGIFAPMTPVRKTQEELVRIVIFGSKKEYEPYRLNDYAVAYYSGGAERDSIVLSNAATEIFPIAVHEYVHLVARHSGLRLPPWLNEGLAELYSTLEPRGKQVLVGSLIPGRRQALSRSTWVPLSQILAADHSSAFYNEKDKAGSLYNEGWALTHMLALGAPYRQQFPALVNAISGGEDSVRALERVYSKPLAKIEDDLLAYLDGFLFQGVLLPAVAEKSQGPSQGQAVDGTELELVLLDLHVPPERQSEVRQRLERLAAENPGRPEPLVRMGYDSLRRGQTDQARQDFAKAFDLGARNQRMLWDYGRMAAGESPSRGAQVLARLLELEPGRTEARIELAGLHLVQRQPADALRILKPITTVSPDLAPRYFKVLAFALASYGDRAEASKAARRMKDHAKSPAEREEAESLLRSLELSASSPPLQALLADAPGAERPALRRGPTPSGPLHVPTQRSDPALSPSTDEGRFVQLECSTLGPVVWVESASGRSGYLIEDPAQITVVGIAGGTVDLTCGPQKGLPVKIEYLPSGPGQHVAGRLRILDFRSSH